MIPDKDNGDNLLLFNLFRNLRSIEFESNMDDQLKLYWPFSLERLLALIEKTNVERIEIRANAGDDKKTWLAQYRENESWSLIREKYKSKNYSVKYVSAQEIVIKKTGYIALIQ